MCTCDLLMPDLFRSTIRKARKPHKCCECGTIIQPGSKYADIFGIWEGDAKGYKQCLRCYQISEKIAEKDDCGHGFGELYEHLQNADYLNFNTESQQWESNVDWLKIANQDPLSCIASDGV